jgi:hypothetical protein
MINKFFNSLPDSERFQGRTGLFYAVSICLLGIIGFLLRLPCPFLVIPANVFMNYVSPYDDALKVREDFLSSLLPEFQQQSI